MEIKVVCGEMAHPGAMAHPTQRFYPVRGTVIEYGAVLTPDPNAPPQPVAITLYWEQV